MRWHYFYAAWAFAFAYLLVYHAGRGNVYQALVEAVLVVFYVGCAELVRGESGATGEE